MGGKKLKTVFCVADYGATPLELPSHIEGASLQECRARIDLMKALSSPNYIALTSPDPVESCFKLSQLVRWLAQAELELADEYLKIEEHCEALAAEFVNAVEDSDDIMVLLRHASLNIHTSPVFPLFFGKKKK